MSAALSISAAATECPDRVALIVGDQCFTYSELAERVRSLSPSSENLHRAHPSLDIALILYASLEALRPLTLISATASDAERDEVRRRIAPELPSNPALVLFTSGSSGASKGVLLSREALLASAEAAGTYLGWAEDDRWLCCLPLSHIGGLSVLLRCLVARKTVILLERFETSAVAGALAQHRATHISLVPTMLWRLLEDGATAPPDLRIVLMGGAALSPGLAERGRAAGFALRTSYGMTETCSMIACDGRPLPGVQWRWRPEEPLEISGPMLMDGYLPSDDVPPAITGGWLRTRDRAGLDEEGRLQILGRIDDTIISGGENIDLAEIERLLLEDPRVRMCLAIGVPDEEWGQRLVALVVCQGSPQDIDINCLSGHRRPKALIDVERIPLLENGKPDRREALRIALARQT